MYIRAIFALCTHRNGMVSFKAKAMQIKSEKGWKDNKRNRDREMNRS